MEFLKGQTRRLDLCNQVSPVIKRMKPPWSRLANVTIDGSQNLTGKNVELLKRIQDKEKNPKQEVIFLPCVAA